MTDWAGQCTLEKDSGVYWDSSTRGAGKRGPEKGINGTSSLLTQNRSGQLSSCLTECFQCSLLATPCWYISHGRELALFRACCELPTVLSTLCASSRPTLMATQELGLISTPLMREVKEPCSTSVLYPRTHTKKWLSQDLKLEQSDFKPCLLVSTLNCYYGKKMQMENTLIDF